MILEQYYLECLSHASYLVGDETTGRAIVVDPRRDIGEYLTDADRLGLSIEGVVNTHFHADFVSGHLELVEATGAWIGFGEQPKPSTRSAASHTASAYRSEQSTWRSCDTRSHVGVDQHPGARAPGYRTHGGAHRRLDVHRRRRPARPGKPRRRFDSGSRPCHVPHDPRHPVEAPRRDHGDARARSRIVVREEPLIGTHLDDRPPTPHEPIGAADGRRRIRRPDHRRSARRTRLLLDRCRHEQARPSTAEFHAHRPGTLPRGGSEGIGLRHTDSRCSRRRRLRRRPSTRLRERGLRRALRRDRAGWWPKWASRSC